MGGATAVEGGASTGTEAVGADTPPAAAGTEPAGPFSDKDFQHFSREAPAHNVNEQTLLATDYLNHFNEIAMILELVADCPDCLEEAQTWRPKSYAAHFSDSAFAARDFVIAAYNQAPAVFRDPFEQTVAAMNALVEQGVKDLVARSERDEPAIVGDVARRISQDLQRLIDLASSIIHGAIATSDQAAVDAILDN